MQSLFLIGGGRWSRVLFSVFDRMLPSDWEIFWFTKHSVEQARNTAKKTCRNTTVTTEFLQVLENRPTAAVVATYPYLHADYVSVLLQNSIPTLCEKPMALSLRVAERLCQLSLDLNCPLGINLEFAEAKFLERFRQTLKIHDVERVELEWCDPEREVRYEESKSPDQFTSILYDAFPHCWSVLVNLTAGSPLFPHDLNTLENIHKIEVSDLICSEKGLVTVNLRFPKFEVIIKMSRTSERRVRRLSINEGVQQIDFSLEPDEHEDDRPLSKVVRNFLSQVQTKSNDWKQAASCWLPFFVLAGKAEQLLRQEQIALIAARNFDIEDQVVRDISIRMLAPDFAHDRKRFLCRSEININLMKAKLIEIAEDRKYRR